MKNLFKSWFASAAKLTPEQNARLATWQHLQETDAVTGFENARYVVVDVETTGLDLNNDTLISIGAVHACLRSLWMPRPYFLGQ